MLPVVHKESRPPQVLLLHLGGKLLHVESSDDDIEILQHHEGDEGLVEVEAIVGRASVGQPSGQVESLSNR